MVDISLQAVEGESLPKDLYLSLRVGEQQKFSKANCARTYKFPASPERRYGKLELYRRIGVSTLSLDGEHFQGAHELAIQVEDERVQNKEVKYRFCLGGGALPAQTNEAAAAPSDSNKQTPEKVVQAREYLQHHQLEQRLSEAMQAVLRERPEDPAAFIAQKLQSKAGVLKKVDEPVKVPEPQKSEPAQAAAAPAPAPAPAAPAAAPAAATPPAAAPAAEPTPAAPAAKEAAPKPAPAPAAKAPEPEPAPPQKDHSAAQKKPEEPKVQAKEPPVAAAPAPAPAPPVQAAPAPAAQPQAQPEVRVQLPMPSMADYPLPDNSFADPISSATLMIGDGMCSFANIGRPAVMIF